MTLYKFNFNNKAVELTGETKVVVQKTNKNKKEKIKLDLKNETIASSAERLYSIIIPLLQKIENNNLLPQIFPSQIDFVFYRTNDFLEKLFNPLNSIPYFEKTPVYKAFYGKNLAEQQYLLYKNTYEIRLNAELLTDNYFKYKRYHQKTDQILFEAFDNNIEKIMAFALAHEFGHVIFNQSMAHLGQNSLYYQTSLIKKDNIVKDIVRLVNESFADGVAIFFGSMIGEDSSYNVSIENFRKVSLVRDNSSNSIDAYAIDWMKKVNEYCDKNKTLEDNFKAIFKMSLRNVSIELDVCFNNEIEKLNNDLSKIYPNKKFNFRRKDEFLDFLQKELAPNFTSIELNYNQSSSMAALTKESILDRIKSKQSQQNVVDIKQKLKP